MRCLQRQDATAASSCQKRLPASSRITGITPQQHPEKFHVTTPLVPCSCLLCGSVDRSHPGSRCQSKRPVRCRAIWQELAWQGDVPRSAFCGKASRAHQTAQTRMQGPTQRGHVPGSRELKPLRLPGHQGAVRLCRFEALSANSRSVLKLIADQRESRLEHGLHPTMKKAQCDGLRARYHRLYVFTS